MKRKTLSEASLLLAGFSYRTTTNSSTRWIGGGYEPQLALSIIRSVMDDLSAHTKGTSRTITLPYGPVLKRKDHILYAQSYLTKAMLAYWKSETLLLLQQAEHHLIEYLRA